MEHLSVVPTTWMCYQIKYADVSVKADRSQKRQA